MGANKKTAKQLAKATERATRTRMCSQANRAAAEFEAAEDEDDVADQPALPPPSREKAPPGRVSAARLGAGPVALAGEHITSFGSLVSLSTRHGVRLPEALVAGCVASLGSTGLRPSPVQAECWGWLIRAAPPDLVAISSTGSGKTLAFLLPALADALTRPATPVAAAPAAAAAVPGPAAGQPQDEGQLEEAEGAADAPDADAAMRAAATAAYKRAVGEGKTQDEAKAVARAAGKRAWKEAKKGGAAPKAAAGDGASPAAPATPSVLVLGPTRELCQQTAETARRICAHAGAGLATACVVGGVDYQRQRAELFRAPPALLVATPGRLLSLCGETPASSRARQQAAGAAGAPAAAAEPRACALEGVATLVLDEADRLLEMGFEDDLAAIRRLVGAPAAAAAPPAAPAAPAAPPAPWTLMLSATWTVQTARLARAWLAPGAVHVSVGGEQTAAAASVRQVVEVVRGRGAPRLRRLVALLHDYLGGAPPTHAARGGEGGDDEEDEEDEEEDEEGIEEEGEEEGGEAGGDEGEGEGEGGALAAAAAPAAAAAAAAAEGGEEAPRAIVFVVYKKQAKELSRALGARGFAVAPLHGDMGQGARAASLARFRAGAARVLVATDVAARGLDVPAVSHVLNFSVGGSIDTYVHRVGRCGRAGRAGVAHTLVVDGDEPLAAPLAALLRQSRQPVPPALLELAASAQRAEAAARAGGGAGADAAADEDEDDVLEQRRANRERQLEQFRLKQAREKKQQRRQMSGHRY